MTSGNRGRRYTFSPTAPTRVTDRSEGGYDHMLSVARSYKAAGWTAEVDQIGDSPVWTCIATADGEPGSDDSDLQNTHELRVNLLNPDLKANRHLQSQFTTGTAPKQIAEVQRLADSVRSGSTTYDEAVASIAASSVIESTDIAVATNLLDLLITGNDTFVEFQYVYRHTFNYGSINDKVADFEGVQQIYSTAGLRFKEAIPDSLELPDGEWLKLAPEQLVERGNRETLSYEYWWAESWSTLLYATAPGY